MDGFINLYKPKDFTSHDALNIVRRCFPGTKIGHGGTLDPAATGVLPVCLGRGTKLQDLVMGGDKAYETDVVFGVDSLSLDLSGDFTVTDPDFVPDRALLEKVLAELTGAQLQVPPVISAIKRGGVPLYKRARRGEKVEAEARAIEIHEIILKDIFFDGARYRARIAVSCSKGTYIRALGRDIGRAMGTAAVIDRLVRTRAGMFSLENAVTMEELKRRCDKGDFSFVMPPEAALTSCRRFELSDGLELKTIRDGGSIAAAGWEDGSAAVYDPWGGLFAVGRVNGEKLRPEVLFCAPRRRKEKMKVFGGEAPLPAGLRTAVVIGNFDGVHLGHAALIDRCVKEAERAGLFSLVMTFSPHPKSFFSGESYPAICSREEKIRHIDALGADGLLILPFDRAFADLSPEAFVSEILVNRLHCEKVFIGDDFTFGRGGAGNAAALKELAAACGIDVRVLGQLRFRGEAVSSTRIKALLASGNVTEAGRLLGRAYSVSGEVVHGRELGRTIGFPTANLELPAGRALPGAGVYVASVSHKGKKYDAVACVGHRPTIAEGQSPNLEAHLLDHSADLYGETVTVTLISFLRGEKKFASVEELKAAIAADKEKAQSFFEKRRNNTCNRG